jgi:hypothetical protein
MAPECSPIPSRTGRSACATWYAPMMALTILPNLPGQAGMPVLPGVEDRAGLAFEIFDFKLFEIKETQNTLNKLILKEVYFVTESTVFTSDMCEREVVNSKGQNGA